MSETPSLSAAKSTVRPSGRRQGAWASSSGTCTFFRTLPSSAETRKKLRPLPGAAEEARRCRRWGSKASERPATNSLLMARLSQSVSKPPVRFWITAPSFTETSTTSASPSERFAVMTAAISPEGLGAKPKAWVKFVFSGSGERSRPKSSGPLAVAEGLEALLQPLVEGGVELLGGGAEGLLEELLRRAAQDALAQGVEELADPLLAVARLHELEAGVAHVVDEPAGEGLELRPGELRHLVGERRVPDHHQVERLPDAAEVVGEALVHPERDRPLL